MATPLEQIKGAFRFIDEESANSTATKDKFKKQQQSAFNTTKPSEKQIKKNAQKTLDTLRP